MITASEYIILVSHWLVVQQDRILTDRSSFSAPFQSDGSWWQSDLCSNVYFSIMG